MTERLTLAAVDQIATRGAAATSARSVAAAAGVAASAINYNFGGIEHLFSAAFGHGVEATISWQERVECDIAALPTGPAGAALALEQVIAEWTSTGRSLALLYQEALATVPATGPALAWARLWRDFWRRAAARCGLGETEARLMHALFESEALYNLSSWSPALERAALRELCDHAAHVWFGGAPRAPAGAFALAEHAAGVLTEGSVAPAAMKIAEAAAAVVEVAGLGGLTHRAVAARAGVTTGAVTHHFRTAEDLTAGAVRGQVMAMVAPEENPSWRPRTNLLTVDQLFAGIVDYAVTDRPWGPSLRRRHLFLAAVRRPELAASAAVIRFAHGGTLGRNLEQLFEVPPELRSLHAGSMSRIISSSWFACVVDPQPRAAQRALLEAMWAGALAVLPQRPMPA